MRTIQTTNVKVITNDAIDLVTELIESNMMMGISFDQDESLFVHGFVYNSDSNLLVRTMKMERWSKLDSELTYNIGKIPMSEVHKEFQMNKKDILIMKNGQTEEGWMNMCDSYKLFDLEVFNLFITKRIKEKVTLDELIEELEIHILEFYPYLLD